MDEDDRLRLDAFVALSGAEFVRQRILHGLSMGNPSLEAEAYLMKSRVKSSESLVTKVRERRETKTTYQAKDARDVVGLRLLTLFRNELPILVRRFMSFVEWSQKPPFSLFSGSHISECIEELIIYATDTSDPYVNLCVSEFATFGFFTEEDPRYRGGKKVIVDRKDSRYSSIHVVLFANGARNIADSRVPVEVQLRTSVEDIWGEIDHRLRYKLRRRDRISDSPDDPNTDSIEDEVDAYLRTLKKSLDASSDMADLIETRIRSLDFEKHPLQTSKSNVSVGAGELEEMPVSRKHTRMLKDIVSRLHSVYSDIQHLSSPPTASETSKLLARFEDAQGRIENSLSNKSFIDNAMQTAGERLIYLLKMERALCFYWMASLTRTAGAHDPATYNEIAAVEYLRRCLATYDEVSSLKLFASDPILAFRVASALDLKGDYELARSKYREGVSLMQDRADLPADSYFRSRIPMQYAISLWQRAEDLKRRASEFGGLALVRSERTALYKTAIEVTRSLLTFPRPGASNADWPISGTEQQANVRNNLLDFALSFVSAGGPVSELDELGLDRAFLLGLLQELVAGGVDGIKHVTFADTVRAAAKFLGDIELNQAAAHRVLQLIDDKDFALSLPDVAYREMRFDAQSDLE